MPRDPRRDLDPRASYALDLTARLRAPDATVGWQGDPHLFMCWNRLENRWEVWREEDEGDRLIVRAPGGETLDLTALLRGLVQRDTHLRENSHVKQMERLFKDNEAIERARNAAEQDRIGEQQDRLYHAAAKDVGHQYGYVRPISVPDSLSLKVKSLPETAPKPTE